jgi:hypothetical protein
MEAIIAVVLGLLGLGAFAYAKGRRQGGAVAAQAQTKAKVAVASAEDARSEDRRAARGSALARTVKQIHTEANAQIASKRTDRAAAAEALAKAKAWDEGSSF